MQDLHRTATCPSHPCGSMPVLMARHAVLASNDRRDDDRSMNLDIARRTVA